MKPGLHPQEPARLAALRDYRILDTAPETAFDDLAFLASHICETPIAIISLIDEDRQWFKAKRGVEATETPREHAFCAHAILEKELFVVEDARLDPRFSANPMVRMQPHIRFYAGTQFYSSDQMPLGTLCVIDSKPRQLTVDQRLALEALGRQVQGQLELRRNLTHLKSALAERDEADRVQQALMVELRRAYDDSQRLSGLLPVSSACKFSITIPADVKAIDPVVEGVMEVARQMKSAEGREFETEIAIREALANAIIHGCKNDPSKKVQCSVACDEHGELLIVVRDPGGTLDPAQVPDPTQGANLYADHGRGVHLINHLMDNVEVVVEKAAKTEVRMTARPRPLSQ